MSGIPQSTGMSPASESIICSDFKVNKTSHIGMLRKLKEYNNRFNLPRNNGHQRWFGQGYQSPKCYIPHGALSFRSVGHPFQKRLSTKVCHHKLISYVQIHYIFTFYLINDMLTTGLLAPGSSKMFTSSGMSKKISTLERKTELVRKKVTNTYTILTQEADK